MEIKNIKMYHKTEADIIQSWISKDSPPLVSICCPVYNHETYIQSAIDSFLSQITTFSFEILIHDDASTDTSPQIIQKYQQKYPNLIKPIFQNENQYSQGKKITPILAKVAKGEYIAICEGDDYWIDPKKIQKQIDALMKNPDCDLAFHPCHTFLDSDPKINTVHNNYYTSIKVIDVEDVILGGGGFCPSAALLIKKSIFDQLPDWFNSTHAGDYYLQVFGALNGGALFLPDIMSAYRHSRPDSLTTTIRTYDSKKILSLLSKELNGLDHLINDLPSKYDTLIYVRKAEVLKEFANKLLKTKNFHEFKLLIEKSREVYKNSSKSQQLLYYMRHFPYLLYIIQKIKFYFKPLC